MEGKQRRGYRLSRFRCVICTQPPVPSLGKKLGRTYVTIPLKDVRYRCFVGKVQIAIEHRVLSHSCVQIIRLLLLFQYQAVPGSWKNYKWKMERIVTPFRRWKGREKTRMSLRDNQR